MSEPRMAGLEGGRRFGEYSSKKVTGSRNRALLAIDTGSCAGSWSSTVSGTGVLRSSYPFVPTGIGAIDLWKVNKNHRIRTVECRYPHLGQKQNIDAYGQWALEFLPQLWLKRVGFERLISCLFISYKSDDIPPAVRCI